MGQLRPHAYRHPPGSQRPRSALGERHALRAQPHRDRPGRRAAVGRRRRGVGGAGTPPRRAARDRWCAPRHGRPAIPHGWHAARHARLNHVRWFDRGEALMEVEAGITWPDVIRGYLALQRGPGPVFRHPAEADRRGPPDARRRGSRQTFTAAACAAQPFVADIEGLEVVTAAARSCAAAARNTRSCFATWWAATDCSASSRP